MLHLVRHGRPVVDRTRPAHEWPLDPAYADDVRALRVRLPSDAVWFSSPEPKAVATARLLTDGQVGVVDGLHEHQRLTSDWMDDFAGVVRRAFDNPNRPAHDGWEPVADTGRRVVSTVHELLGEHRGRDVVLVGHGTAWTLLRAAIRHEDPDLDWWASLAVPDVASFPSPVHLGDMLTP